MGLLFSSTTLCSILAYNKIIMRIHILSDLHNEFDPYIPMVQDVDMAILADDTDIKTRGVEWAKRAFFVLSCMSPAITSITAGI
jgi:hypothetical protein